MKHTRLSLENIKDMWHPVLLKMKSRGNDFRLQKLWVRYDLHKFGFSSRVVNKWNSLSKWVVSANTANTFKARSDKFWHSQDIVYDFRAVSYTHLTLPTNREV